MSEICAADELVDAFHQGATFVFFAVDIDLRKSAVLVERDCGVVQEAIVADEEQAAVLVNAAHMVLQLFAVCKRVVELLHQLLLLVAQLVRVGGVDGGEIVVAESVFLAIDGNCTFLIIN